MLALTISSVTLPLVVPESQVALQNLVSIFCNPHQVMTMVKNRVAAFAVLGHGGPLFEPAGILTRARTEVFPA
jgi:hypothetical protein